MVENKIANVTDNTNVQYLNVKNNNKLVNLNKNLFKKVIYNENINKKNINTPSSSSLLSLPQSQHSNDTLLCTTDLTR